MDFSALGERATDGNIIYPNQCAIAYTYTGAGSLETETLAAYSGTYVKTYTYDGNGKLTNMSLWVRQ